MTLSPDTKDWIHLGIEVATATGVWGIVWRVFRSAHSHKRPETKGAPLTYEGIQYVVKRAD